MSTHQRRPLAVRRPLVASLLAASLAAPLALPAAIIYQETFSGPADLPLAGRIPTIRSGTDGGSGSTAWMGPAASNPSRIHANGVMETPSIDHKGASAFLPFTPVPGRVYKLSFAGVAVRSGDWAGAGFSIDRNPEGDTRFRDNTPAFWSLIRRVGSSLTDQTFAGPEVAGQADTSVISSSSLSIVLDTTAGRWTARWFYDGKLVRSGTFPSQPITHVGFGFNTTAAVPAGKSSLGLITLETLDNGPDRDTDGLPDAWEADRFRMGPDEPVETSIRHQNGAADPDGDTYTNLEEYFGGSDPENPRSGPLDTDADGLADAWEIHFLGPIDSPSANPAADPDRDGFSNLQESVAGTDPKDPESRPKPAAAQAASATKLTMDVARNGADAFLAWTPPPGAPRQMEIHRNDRDSAQGRVHLATVSSASSVFLDRVPSENATYWYWLVIPGVNGAPSAEFGPFTTKPAAVWQP